MGNNLEKIRKDAIDIFKESLKAVDPVLAVKKYLKLEPDSIKVGQTRLNLSSFDKIHLIGFGKAAASMARGVEEVLGDKLHHGLINIKYGHFDEVSSKIEVQEAAHPVPDENGVAGARKIINYLQPLGERDLVICVISGGGSALFPAPIEGISLEEKQETTKKLLACGAEIKEINAIRKHISAVKGGQLSRIAYPATLVTLILSDVIGDPLDSIASGPTAPDNTTFSQCLEIIEKYKLSGKIPQKVEKHIRDGAAGKIAETPKAGDEIFERTHNMIVGSNWQAVSAASEKARQLGYNALILSTFVEGETREIARMHAALAKEILKTGNPVERPACLISGGETTVTLRGNGKGGRNQEFVLAAAIDIAGLEGTVVFSAGTDGTDGPTDAAGAIADGRTIDRAERKSLDAFQYLKNNDSYHFFKELDDLVITGPTNTNVMDLRLVLVA